MHGPGGRSHSLHPSLQGFAQALRSFLSYFLVSHQKPLILTTQSQDNQCVIWRSVLLTHPFRECITCHSLAITCSTLFGKVYWVYNYSVSSRQRIIIENSYALCEVVICISVMFVYLVCQPCCGYDHSIHLSSILIHFISRGCFSGICLRILSVCLSCSSWGSIQVFRLTPFSSVCVCVCVCMWYVRCMWYVVCGMVRCMA